MNTFKFHSWLVKFSKWLILGLGLSLVSVTVAWPYVGTMYNRGDVIRVTKGDSLDSESAMTMLDAEIVGRDKERRLVTINAEQATPADREFTEVGLENPKAELDLGEGESIAVESLGGTFHREKNQLLLQGDVEMNSTDGYNIKTQEAWVSLTGNRIETDKAVSGAGPAGTMEAEGMEVDQDKGTIILKGKSKLVFDVKAHKESQAKAAELAIGQTGAN